MIQKKVISVIAILAVLLIAYNQSGLNEYPDLNNTSFEKHAGNGESGEYRKPMDEYRQKAIGIFIKIDKIKTIEIDTYRIGQGRGGGFHESF